ncbi:MAG: hypothetical protein IKD06_03595 [Clostridia bacterium]|nr:hypothetical protein [Clostridia bacterium]
MLLVRAVAAGEVDASLFSPSFLQLSHPSLVQQSAETLLQRTVSSVLGCAQAPALWHKLPNGKPVFTHLPLHFSVAHTQGWVAVAVSDAPVGVDIELADRIRPKIIEKLTAPKTPGLSAAEQWVCWEAMGKCSGRGIALMFDPFPAEQDLPYRFGKVAPGVFLAVAGPKANELSDKFFWN